MPILLSVEPMGGLNPPLTCTITANDGTLAEVQRVIGLASPGDVVCVPAGAWTWAATLTVSKQITLRGAGIGQTIITQADPSDRQLIVWTPQPGGLNRCTGFDLRAPPTWTQTGFNLISVVGAQKTMRIDHCRFEVSSGTYGVQIEEGACGVADHNVFDVTRASYDSGFRIFHSCWTGSCAANNRGDLSWASPDTWGTDDAWYMEDNTIVNDNTGKAANLRHNVVGDGWRGSRVVYRYNTLSNCQLSSGHGTETGGRERGRRQQENYRNTLDFDCAHCGTGGVGQGSGDAFISPAMAGRSGPMMVWDNKVTAQNGSAVTGVMNIGAQRGAVPRFVANFSIWSFGGEIPITSLTAAGVMTTPTSNGIKVAVQGSAPNTRHTQVRVTGATGPDAAIYNGVHPVNVWTTQTQVTIGLPGVPSADATGTLILTSPWDGNTNVNGYPILDQGGYGQGDLFSNTAVPDPPYQWPNQVLTPNLYWLNQYQGAPATTVSVAYNAVDGSPLHLLNREFFTDAANSLIRSGPSPLPLTCSVDQLYWATDDGSWNTKPGGVSGKLYKCTAPNVWTPWYGRNNPTGEPLQYPHPLTLLI